MNELHSDPQKRIDELESELARVKTERDLYKSGLYDVMRDSEFDRPTTPEELDEMMNNTCDETIEDILSEFEQKIG